MSNQIKIIEDKIEELKIEVSRLKEPKEPEFAIKLAVWYAIGKGGGERIFFRDKVGGGISSYTRCGHHGASMPNLRQASLFYTARPYKEVR